MSTADRSTEEEMRIWAAGLLGTLNRPNTVVLVARESEPSWGADSEPVDSLFRQQLRALVSAVLAGPAPEGEVVVDNTDWEEPVSWRVPNLEMAEAAALELGTRLQLLDPGHWSVQWRTFDPPVMRRSAEEILQDLVEQGALESDNPEEDDGLLDQVGRGYLQRTVE